MFSTIPESANLFSQLLFLIKDCRWSFVQINGYMYRHLLSILISIENFYLVEKQRKEYFVKYTVSHQFGDTLQLNSAIFKTPGNNSFIFLYTKVTFSP